MARNPVTAKERRGLIAVAVVSLLVVGGGYALRSCRSVSSSYVPAGAVVGRDGRLIPADSAGMRTSGESGRSDVSGDSDSTRHGKKSRDRSGRQKPGKKKSGSSGKTPPPARDYLEDPL